MKVTKEHSTKEIADRINAHLKRFEASKKINAENARGHHPYYHAGAGESSGKVQVVYVGYQGETSLNRVQAGWYLELLDRGFVGRHFEAFRKFGEASGTLE